MLIAGPPLGFGPATGRWPFSCLYWLLVFPLFALAESLGERWVCAPCLLCHFPPLCAPALCAVHSSERSCLRARSFCSVLVTARRFCFIFPLSCVRAVLLWQRLVLLACWLSRRVASRCASRRAFPPLLDALQLSTMRPRWAAKRGRISAKSGRGRPKSGQTRPNQAENGQERPSPGRKRAG